MPHLENPIKILCVDPGREIFRQLQEVFIGHAYQIMLELNIGRVLERFEREGFAVLVISSAALRSNQWVGIELLEVVSAKSPGTQILFLINPKEIRLAASALKAGSYHYSKLPVSSEELKLLVESALDQRPQYAPNLLLQTTNKPPTFESMVGGSPAMREVYRQIRQAAATDIPVLLSGETGTGKDLASQAIHQLSSRKDGPYVPVHLGALPEDLVASELFGHEKGAFTGAWEHRLGCFELADKGTVFLDEISTVEEKIQISLLRLLEDSTLHRIGGVKGRKVNTRVIAATNENLEDAVERGAFREDLFFRLDVLHIHMPPLKQRDGDVPLLIDHFLKEFNQAYDKTVVGISPECVARLHAYDWPGNVRELKNVINRAVVVCVGDVLLPEHLPGRLHDKQGGRAMVSLPVGSTLEEMERELIKRTLDYAGGNRARTAELLGISRRTLYNKIDRFNL
ncbi:MAG: sigma-54 dependent transcriptional regulator [Desulfarculaceae bacterium]|nr:sigma-54 dependent transcriptional regulator [Desulfarculaceae bacterium]MCF8072955.1 sigma-54 dependent transcriptional regulator [Desulfarculaceae bacterium]MCF8100749.1 sigma-54 dependent transcriptional regulator [Desulfarculaceae bacterium]MCF8115487.1 sigma-54 dependent transcriptional regulator [Desulfarculaceae bacterium]